jgi:cation/acetate symporter
VQFIKGSLLVIFCATLTVMILWRGLTTNPSYGGRSYHSFRIAPAEEVLGSPNLRVLPESGGWQGKPYVRVKDQTTGIVSLWRKMEPPQAESDASDGASRRSTPTRGEPAEAGTPAFFLAETQHVTILKDGTKLVNGLPHGKGEGRADLHPVGHICRLPEDGPATDGSPRSHTGSLGPLAYFRTLQASEIVLWESDKISDADGSTTTVYYQRPTHGNDVLVPGASPTFSGVRGERLLAKLDFLSLMLALFCGTASLPHILIRYYTVRDQMSARKSTVVGIASIGFFYILTLYLGLGAMTSGTLDVTNSNMAAPLLARSFGELPFAIISAIAFTTVLGTVSGLIMASSGAVAHDLMENFLKIRMNDHEKVRAGKFVAVAVGAVAMILGVLFEKMNVSFLVGWAFNIAASANLPSLVMLLFWKRTTKQGITAAIIVGMVSALGWVLLSAQAYKDVYGLPPEHALVPFSQPGIVTIPLGFAVLVVVSLLTQPEARRTSLGP